VKLFKEQTIFRYCLGKYEHLANLSVVVNLTTDKR